MLKDITIGQYIYGTSPVHRLDPRFKLLAVIGFIVLLFICKNFWSIGLLSLFCAFLYYLAGIPVKMILKSLKPVIPIILLTSILNMFFVDGDPLFSFWKVTVTVQGLRYALVISVRIIILIASSSLLTYTTSPIELTNALESLLKPLTKINFPVHELSMMMSIALRFIPTIISETDRIMSAQKSRGADLDSGNFIQRIKALLPILVPLFVSAFKRADELALAMECRCYNGGEGRTRLKQLKFKLIDIAGTAVIAVIAAAVIILNRVFPAVM